MPVSYKGAGNWGEKLLTWMNRKPEATHPTAYHKSPFTVSRNNTHVVIHTVNLI